MLLTIGGNPKVLKSRGLNVHTAILHLAPANASGRNVCPTAIQGNLDCLRYCLNTAGRGGIFKKGETSNVIQRARIRKTNLFFDDRAEFFRQLVQDIKKLCKQAYAWDMVPAVRLNGTSDLPWESIKDPATGQCIMDHFPDVQFYDYTKSQSRMLDFMAGALPKNYYLTISVHEKSDPGILAWILENGGTAAMIFHGRWIPDRASFECFAPDFPVLDGDKSDARFLDRPGHIVGLTAKGKARKAQSASIRD